jgi:hypothetical protein
MSPFETMFAGPIPLTFEVVVHPVLTAPDYETLWCPECMAPIDRHQPDENQPTQLLGSCSLCSKWFLLIELEGLRTLTLQVELPSADRIRELVEAFESNA